MAKLTALVFIVLATVALQSGGEVVVPFNSELYVPSADLNAFCTVQNETFVGWFKVDGDKRTKIDVVASRADVKANPGVLIETRSPNEKTCTLIFPKGSPVTIGGTYECTGSKSKASLVVQVRPNLGSLKKYQYLHIGKNEKIVLGAITYPYSTFVWKKNLVVIDFASDPRLTLEKDGSVVITNVKESDAGRYDVHIDWEGRNTADEIINVTVIEKPKFLSTPTPSTLKGITGYDYKFCCNHTGMPKPTLKWYKTQGSNEVQLDVTNPRYSVDANCMSIKTLGQSDAAQYKCTSTNSAGQASATVTIEKVGVKPSVDTLAEDSMLKSVNKPLEVECTGKGDPLPTMEWTNGGKVLANQKQEPGKSTMMFKSLRLKDTANYTCTARNGLFYDGKEVHASRNFQLNVIAKPLLNKNRTPSPVYSFLYNKNSVLVQCVFEGFPDPAVEITKNGVSLANGTIVASLYVTTTNLKDFGDYVCDAKNNHGSASHTVKLKEAVVPGKPINVKVKKTCKSALISWEPPVDNGGMQVLNYVITVHNSTTKFPSKNVIWKNLMHKIEYVFKPETTYKVELSARNIVGAGAPEVFTFTTNKYCKPGPPLISTIGGKRTKADLTVFGPDIKVTWKAPQDNGFDENLGYHVEWRVRKEFNQTEWEKSELLQKLEYDIKGLKKGKYEIRVYGVSKAGNGKSDMRVVNVDDHKENKGTQGGPVAGERKGGLSKGTIAGIVIAILLIVLITIDLFCCFFNSCGLIFCCQRACCGGKYSPDGKSKKDSAEMEKLSKKPAPEDV
ncbi:fasciclin-2-like isoform X2 [Actinia tenebrosa]|uniref:Fasciclin-2-like isoform X2 n=1 Tax=Actinia tenebrosa TaxID=6105 RepID=A0A6P8IKQ5_ACTTE|nr:fasciclin-2-like isoform X2 [Actinia tenebrosa]